MAFSMSTICVSYSSEGVHSGKRDEHTITDCSHPSSAARTGDGHEVLGGNGKAPEVAVALHSVLEAAHGLCGVRREASSAEMQVQVSNNTPA